MSLDAGYGLQVTRSCTQQAYCKKLTSNDTLVEKLSVADLTITDFNNSAAPGYSLPTLEEFNDAVDRQEQAVDQGSNPGEAQAILAIVKQLDGSSRLQFVTVAEIRVALDQAGQFQPNSGTK